MPIVGTTVGADLLSGPQAIAGVDVSGGHSGGTTAASTAGVPLAITISPVNDAPTAVGSAELAPGVSGSVPPPSDSVVSLFTPGFGDAVDQQRSVLNPTGSLANALAGVVVVGNTTPVANGTWRYSTDGGASWNPVPATVSDATGLLLGGGVRLAFFSSTSFSGRPAPLVVRLVDTSTDVPVAGALTGAALANTTIAILAVDVSGARHGGITAVSDGMVPLNTTVNQPPPIITPPPILPPPPTSALFADAGLRLRQGGLESDFLVGASVYRTLIAAQPGTINVSADVFSGSDSAKNLRFEAGSISGGPLPPWIAFDPILLRFSGTPPEAAVGTLDLRVIATDKAGRQATAEVHIVITRPPRDILGLLRPSATPPPIIVPQPLPPVPAQAPPEALPTGAPADAPAPANAPPAEGGAPAGPASPPNAPSESMPERSTERAFQRFGLSAQLREQSLAGRLARSRALMNALGGGRASL